MQEHQTHSDERIDQRSEHTPQLEHQHLGGDGVTCQICKRELREGDTVTVYTYRAAGTTGFDVGYPMCGADIHGHPTAFMRGVHEVVVTGRIGLCTDVATQRSWLVLLAPEPRRESLPRSQQAQTISDETVGRNRGPTQDCLPRDGAATNQRTTSEVSSAHGPAQSDERGQPKTGEQR